MFMLFLRGGYFYSNTIKKERFQSLEYAPNGM